MALSAKIENGDMLLRLPLEQPMTSKRGKSKVDASSHEALAIRLPYKGKYLLVYVDLTGGTKEKKWQADVVVFMQDEEPD
jgi:hypothetical protein